MPSYTQEQITALRDAIATGVLTVRSATGETVTYRDLADMQATLAMMEADTNAFSGRRRLTHVTPVYDRGV